MRSRSGPPRSSETERAEHLALDVQQGELDRREGQHLAEQLQRGGEPSFQRSRSSCIGSSPISADRNSASWPSRAAPP